MSKKLLYFFIGLMFVANSSIAQLSAYNFGSDTGSVTQFVPITGGTTLTLGGDNDDGVSNGVPIGFTFNFNGVTYTTFGACANGFMGFNTLLPGSSAANWTNNLTSSTAAPRPLIAPYWDDLLINGSVSYVTTGTAPTRVLTVQWLNAGQYLGGSVISFQVKLYETSNMIEFYYRQETAGTVEAGSGASIGLAAVATGSGNFLSLQTSGYAATTSTTTEVTSLLRPSTRQVYRFDPVYCTAKGGITSGSEEIANVTFASINNSSTLQGQYENFTNVISGITPGNTYPISITNNANSYSGDKVTVFIDYNRNGVFTDAGESVFTATGAGQPTPYTGSVVVPAGASLGVTRMRVRLDDAGSAGANSTSCGQSAWAQVEDYSLLIQTCANASGSALPASQTVCTGSATVTSNATGTGLTQQWQVSTDNGVTWTDLTNVAPYSGVTTATLTINPVSAALNLYQYRVKLGGTCTPAGTFTSASVLNTLAVAPTVSPAAPTACLGSGTLPLTITAPGTAILGPQTSLTVSSPAALNLAITDNSVAGVTTTLSAAGIPAGSVVDSIQINFNITHTWDGDVGINFKAPNGQAVNLVSHRGGSADNFTNTTISPNGVTLVGAVAPFTGIWKPDYIATAEPSSTPQTTTNIANLYTTPNGTYTLAINDNAATDVGTLVNWNIKIFYKPSTIVGTPSVWSPTTNLYTDAAGTINYTGTPATTVYYKPTAAGTFNYSVSYSAPPCVSAVTTVPITVNTPPSITTQPASVAVCATQGTVSFTTAATGTAPFTYQWQADNGGGFANIANGGSYSGVTTATLTVTTPPASWNGFKYRCVVTGQTPCAAATTNGLAVLTVNPVPTVTIAANPYRNLYPGLVTTLSASSSPAAASYIWFRNGSQVATSPTVSADVDKMGDYNVRIVDVNGCFNTSGIITIGDSLTGKVFIYPSPNKGQFQVRYYSLKGNSLPRTLTVYDEKGAQVLTQTYTVGRPYDRMDVDMRNHGKGVYRVELGDRNGMRLATGTVVVL